VLGASPNLDFVAIWAHGVFAQLTLPPSRQEPLALWKRTLAHKCLFFDDFPGTSRATIDQREPLVHEPNDLVLRPNDLHLSILYERIVQSNLFDAGDGVERRGYEAALALKQNHLPVLFERPIAKCRRASLIDDIPGPNISATHAVWVSTEGHEVVLDAASTRAKIAKGTRDPFAI